MTRASITLVLYGDLCNYKNVRKYVHLHALPLHGHVASTDMVRAVGTVIQDPVPWPRAAGPQQTHAWRWQTDLTCREEINCTYTHTNLQSYCEQLLYAITILSYTVKGISLDIAYLCKQQGKNNNLGDILCQCFVYVLSRFSSFHLTHRSALQQPPVVAGPLLATLPVIFLPIHVRESEAWSGQILLYSCKNARPHIKIRYCMHVSQSSKQLVGMFDFCHQ